MIAMDMIDNLTKEIQKNLHSLAHDYVKANTTFSIGYIEGNEKLHVILTDVNSGVIIKKVNCAKLLTKFRSDDLINIFRLALE